MFRNIIMLALTVLVPLKAFSSELYLNLPTVADSILAEKKNALTLKQVQDSLVNDQIDIQISYEKLIQAQKKIGVARAQYFPYGLGTVGAMYLLNIWNPILLVELVTSLPSKVYFVQSEKNMRMATIYLNEALAENIKNQTAKLFYTILKEESSFKVSKIQLELMETLYSVTQDKVAVGLSTEDELRSLELRILDLRDICLKFSGYLAEEKAAFNQLIAQTPTQGAKIELQPNGKFLDMNDYKLDSETLSLQTIDRAPELIAADYMITAASKAKKSTSWSILSFAGIGFDYWGRVQVAGSKVEQARLNRELVETNLSNQTYVINNSFHRTMESFESEKAVFNDTALFYEAEFAGFKAQEFALDRLLEAELLYMKDFNEMISAHYDSLIKLNDLERAILGSAKGNLSDAEKISISVKELNNSKVSLSVKSDESISSVEYIFDNSYLYPISSSSLSSDFSVVLKVSQTEVLVGHANVTLTNGKIITKKFKI